MAREYSISDVSDFLAAIKLDRYINTFAENDVSGDFLLGIGIGSLNELKVTSALDKIKIMVGFRRKLMGGVVRYPISVITTFLKENKLGQYCNLFESEGLDGDMLLFGDEALVKKMLHEVGIKSELHVDKIVSKFETYTEEKDAV